MLKQLAAPVVFPVSLAAVKNWVRETTTDSDAVLGFLLRAATARVETVTHRAVIYRPVREYFDYLLPYFEIQGCPVRGIKSFQYIDAAGAQQSIAASGYILDPSVSPARITPPYAQYFPPTRVIMNSVWIDYDIGLLCPITAVDTVGDTLTVPGANLAASDPVQFSLDDVNGLGITTSTMPVGLTVGTVYYAKNPTNGGDTFQLSAAPGGAAIDITAAGAGTGRFLGILPDEMFLAMQLMIDSWFRNRSSISPTQAYEMPREGAAEALLAPFKARGFQ